MATWEPFDIKEYKKMIGEETELPSQPKTTPKFLGYKVKPKQSNIPQFIPQKNIPQNFGINEEFWKSLRPEETPKPTLKPTIPTPKLIAPRPVKEEKEPGIYTKLDQALQGILPFGAPKTKGVEDLVDKLSLLPPKGYTPPIPQPVSQKFKGTTFGVEKPTEKIIETPFGKLAEKWRKTGKEIEAKTKEQKLLEQKNYEDIARLETLAGRPITPEQVKRRTEAEINKEAIMAALGFVAPAPAVGVLGKTATTAVPKIMSRLTRPAIETFKALPKPVQTAAKFAGKAGTLLTGGEITRGALFPEAKEQTLPAQAGASLRAGIGDTLRLTGSMAKMLKQESISNKLQKAGGAVTKGYEKKPVEFTWKSVFDPDWWTINVARTAPLTLSLMGASLGVFKGTSSALGRAGLPTFWRYILSTLVGAASSRAIESSYEAAGTYEDYLTRKPGDIKGAEEAAKKVFWNNAKLVGLDATELATAMLPSNLKPVARISKIIAGKGGRYLVALAKMGGVGLQEGFEEGVQEVIQRKALGDKVNFDDKMQESVVIGSLFGILFGGVGAFTERVKDDTINKLPPELQNEIKAEIEILVQEMPEGIAKDTAISNAMEKSDENRKLIETAANKTLDELDEKVKSIGEPQKPIQPIIEKPEEVIPEATVKWDKMNGAERYNAAQKIKQPGMNIERIARSKWSDLTSFQKEQLLMVENEWLPEKKIGVSKEEFRQKMLAKQEEKELAKIEPKEIKRIPEEVSLEKLRERELEGIEPEKTTSFVDETEKRIAKEETKATATLKTYKIGEEKPPEPIVTKPIEETIEEGKAKSKEIAKAIRKVQPERIKVGKGTFKKNIIDGDLIYSERSIHYAPETLASALTEDEGNELLRKAKEIVEEKVTKEKERISEKKEIKKEAPPKSEIKEVKEEKEIVETEEKKQDIKDWLQKAEQDAWKRLESRKGRMLAGLPMDDLVDYAIIGASKLARATLNFAEFSKSMLDDIAKRFGDESANLVKKFMPAIYAQSQAMLEMTPDEVDEMISSAQKETKENIPEEPQIEKEKEITKTEEKKPRKSVIKNVIVSVSKMRNKITGEELPSQVKLQSPYHPEIKEGARKLKGKWSDEKKAWYFDARDEEAIRQLTQDVYGTRGEGEEVPIADIVIKMDDVKNKISGGQLFLLGRKIASRGQRNWKVKLGEGVIIKEGGFPSSGGSVRYPELNPEAGTVLEMRNVPVSLLEKANYPFEVITEVKKKTEVEKPETKKTIVKPEKEKLEIREEKPEGEAETQKTEARKIELEPYIESNNKPTIRQVFTLDNTYVVFGNECIGSGLLLFRKDALSKNILNKFNTFFEKTIKKINITPEAVDDTYKKATEKNMGPKLIPIGMYSNGKVIVLATERGSGFTKIPVVSINKILYDFVSNVLSANIYYGGNQREAQFIVRKTDNELLGIVMPTVNSVLMGATPDDIYTGGKKIVQPVGERREDTERPSEREVEGRGKRTMEEGAAGHVPATGEGGETRGKPEPGSIKREEGEKRPIHPTETKREEREEPVGEGGTTPYERPHREGAGEERLSVPTVPTRENYLITEEDEKLFTRRETESKDEDILKRVYSNIEAIKTLKNLESTDHMATLEEQKNMIMFSGWGRCKKVFDYYRYGGKHWREAYYKLEDILTSEERNAASRTTQYAHYTSPEVVKEMWRAVEYFGFENGRILEPSMGIGYFFGLMPSEIMANSQLAGIEIDPMPGKMAKYLYPKANIQVKGFEETNYPDNFFDLAISNIPFDAAIADPKYPRSFYKSHKYFFAKAIDKIRPGGLIMFITSTGTTDTRENIDIRKYINERADLIGAIRLPARTFKEIAETEVATDIVVLKKKFPGKETTGEKWLESKESGLLSKEDNKPMYLNEYFVKHSEMVLGKLIEDKVWPGRIGVEPTDRPLAEALREAFKRLPANVYEKTEIKEEPMVDREIAEGKPEIVNGTFTIQDDKVYQVINNELVRIEKDEAKLKGLINVRDAVIEVFNIQYIGGSDEALKEAQTKLNKTYDEFVKKYGNLYKNLKIFAGDPNIYLLDTLEELQFEGKKVTSVKKSDIFTERTIRGLEREFKADTPKEALLISLNEKGRIDWERISSLVNKTEEEVQKELEGLVFKNPEGDWETVDQYLSGNVRRKLAVAEEAAKFEPSYQKNVEALKEIQPRDLQPQEIKATLGVPWIDIKFIDDFINNHILDAHEGVEISKDIITGRWKVSIVKSWVKTDTANIYEWGTKAYPATKLLESSLNKKMPVVYKTVYDQWGKETKVINKEETTIAREKQILLEEEFNRWFWSDIDRANSMAEKYNTIFNNLRHISYDGSHMNFPGMSTKIKLNPHQANTVWRIISSPNNTLIAHGVGKGKSFIMAAATMELRRLGIAKKTMHVVPKGTIEQYPNQFKTLYPQAKILVLTSKELPGVFDEKKKEGESVEVYEKRRKEHELKRKSALNRIAVNNWDVVITTPEIFTRLPVSPEWERSFIEREVADLRASLIEARKARDYSKMARRTIAQLEKKIQNFEVKLKLDINEIKKSQVMPFEELGIDYLFVDEAHAYKRLHVTTGMTRVGGIPTGESKRALDMFIKTQWITKLNNGKGIIFSTGTPLTNTMAEMYNLQRFLGLDALKETEISNFDDWAAMFGKIETKPEISPDGRTYQEKNSFRRFINLPELLKQFHSFADVVLNEVGDPGVPKLKNDKRTIITVDPSPEQEVLIENIVKRFEKFKTGDYDPKIDNPLKACVDGQKIALDPRLINPKIPEFPGSKVNFAVANVFEVWKKTKQNRSTQLVFLDLSVPKNKEDFIVSDEMETEDLPPEAEENVVIYRDIKKKLMGMGIPEEEIAFIHEFNTPAKKNTLHGKMNNGHIRILIGSTGKMGLGLNIQKKLAALHHIDCPWRPDELEQREGRILRPGNENKEVEIFVYGTKRSLDTMRWNKVEQKSTFIRQALTAGEDTREMEDIDEVLLSYAEIKAAVSGNPLVEEKFKVDADTARLQLLYNKHLSNRRQMVIDKGNLEEELDKLTKYQEALEKDLARKKDINGDKFSIEISGKTYTDKKEANEAIEKAFEQIKPRSDMPVVSKKIGNIAGLELSIVKTMILTETLGLRSGIITNGFEISDNTRFYRKEGKDNVTILIRTVNSLDNFLTDTKEQIKNILNKIKKLDIEYDKEFEHKEKLNELRVRQREINTQLGIEKYEIETEIDIPSEDEVYGLSGLNELKNKSDIALSNRVKGLPREDNIYGLPLFVPQKTSVKQIARGLKVAVDKGIFKKNTVVVDVGGGLYEEETKYLTDNNITNLVYDPYARTEENNAAVLERVKVNGGADNVALNNVLNVIQKAEEKTDVLRFSYGLLKNNGQMIITVYEGNKSGRGAVREFKDGTYTWQENRLIDSYEDEIRKALPEAKIEKKYNAFIVTKPENEVDYSIYKLAKKKKIKTKPIPVNPREENPSKLSPKATREIVSKLTPLINTVARKTRMGRKFSRLKGAYEKHPHAIRIRKAYLGEWRTVGHELGHAFYFALGIEPDANEMTNIFSYFYPEGKVAEGKEIPEGFAEFFMLWFADNAKARELAPNTTDILEGILYANPRIKEVFDECMAIAESDLTGETLLDRPDGLTIRRGERVMSTGEYRVPWWKRTTFWFADGSIPLKDLFKEAFGLSENWRGKKGLDPAKLYALHGMSNERATQLFIGRPRFKYGNFVLPGKRSLQAILIEADKMMPNAMYWFNKIAKHMRYLERGERGFPIPLPIEEFRNSVNEAREKYPELVKLIEEYMSNLSEINLRLLVAADVITEKTAEIIRAGSKYYIPLYHPEGGIVGGTANPLRSSGPGVTRYKGHTTQTYDVIEATLMRLRDTVECIEMNGMTRAVEESLHQPNMGKFGVFTERPITTRSLELENILKQAAGQVDQETREKLKEVIKELKNTDKNIVENMLGENNADDETRIVNIFMPGFKGDLKKSEPVIVSKHGDKEVYMHLAPDLFESIQSMRPVSYDLLARILNKLAQFSRVGALFNIRYLTNAFVRDIISSGIQSQMTFERSMIGGYMEGALAAVRLSEESRYLFSLYVQSGAYGGAMQEVLNSLHRAMYSEDALHPTRAPNWKRTSTNAFVRIVNFPLDVLRILEEAPRIAEFEAVLKKKLAELNLTLDDLLEGKVPENLFDEMEKILIDTAYASREVVTNFGLHGTIVGFRRYASTVPFLQGSIQGIYRSYRQIKDNPTDTMVRWLVYVAPLTIIAWALSHRDDKYKDMPSESRDRYWWFPVGNNTFIALAKPYEYALPANILERCLDWILKNGDSSTRKPLEDTVTAIKTSFSIEPISMAVQTIIDLMRNKTFFGGPIISQRDMQISPEYRYGSETKKASIKLAHLCALFMGDKTPSPKQIDYFMKGVFGGMGETAQDIVSMFIPSDGESLIERKKGLEYMPMLGPLLYGPGEGGSRTIKRFYDDYDKAQKLYQDYSKKGRILTEKEAVLVSAIPQMRAIAKDLSSLKKSLEEIETDKQIDRQTKRISRLRYQWLQKVATGYLYGAPVPEAPPELEISEADVQDKLIYYDNLCKKAFENALKKEGGPV